MKMRITLLALSMAVASIAPAAGATMKVKIEPAGAFDAISLKGRFRLIFTEGNTESVRLSGDRYLVDNLAVSFEHGVLSIIRPTAYDLPDKETVLVRVTAPKLVKLVTKGFVRAALTGLAGHDFTMINNGAAAATLSGSIGQLSIVSRGIVSIDARMLHAGTVDVSVRGQGNVRVFASNDAKVMMYGEGRVDVLGHPKAHSFKSLAYGVVTMR